MADLFSLNWDNYHLTAWFRHDVFHPLQYFLLLSHLFFSITLFFLYIMLFAVKANSKQHKTLGALVIYVYLLLIISGLIVSFWQRFDIGISSPPNHLNATTSIYFEFVAVAIIIFLIQSLMSFKDYFLTNKKIVTSFIVLTHFIFLYFILMCLLFPFYGNYYRYGENGYYLLIGLTIIFINYKNLLFWKDVQRFQYSTKITHHIRNSLMPTFIFFWLGTFFFAKKLKIDGLFPIVGLFLYIMLLYFYRNLTKKYQANS